MAKLNIAQLEARSIAAATKLADAKKALIAKCCHPLRELGFFAGAVESHLPGGAVDREVYAQCALCGASFTRSVRWHND